MNEATKSHCAWNTVQFVIRQCSTMRCLQSGTILGITIFLGTFVQGEPQLFGTNPAKSVLGAAVGGALLGAAGALALSKIARGRNNRGRNNFRSRSRFGGRRYGKYRRYGRALPDNLGFPEDAIESTAKMDRAFEYLYLASQMDKDTCVRRLICHVNDPKVQDFQQDGTTDMFAQVFGADEFGKLDFGSPLVDLDLAAEIGLQIGAEQCGVVYSRCEKSVPEILREMGEAEKILLQDETFLREQNLLASSE
ncbi:uncharacterized protein LOC131883787 [Tigriopus californicus]|uniref:uncharacterized protein LOC131883787 n=1 Tax=Tigriopus californicus TaxID=6832 RepID=UPI0027D9FBC7|nr:uncharacterized protein LOC131883787 [Tigriopus californicus]